MSASGKVPRDMSFMALDSSSPAGGWAGLSGSGTSQRCCCLTYTFFGMECMLSLSFRGFFNSLPASVFCLALVCAAWLVFAWTRPLEVPSIAHPDESQSAQFVGCSSGASLPLLGVIANKENLKTVKRLSGAETLRVLSDNGPRDLSFEPDRLNVEVDSNRRITGAFCG